MFLALPLSRRAGHPASRCTLVGRHSRGHDILSTDTCRSTSVSLCLSPSLFLYSAHSLSHSIFLSLTHALSFSVLLSHCYPQPVSHPSAPYIFPVNRERVSAQDWRRVYHAYAVRRRIRYTRNTRTAYPRIQPDASNGQHQDGRSSSRIARTLCAPLPGTRDTVSRARRRARVSARAT